MNLSTNFNLSLKQQTISKQQHHIFFCQAPVNVGYLLLAIESQTKTTDKIRVIISHNIPLVFEFLKEVLPSSIKVEYLKHSWHYDKNPFSWFKKRWELKKIFEYYFKNTKGSNIYFFERYYDLLTFYLVNRLAQFNNVTYYELDKRSYPIFSDFERIIKAIIHSFVFSAPIRYVKYGKNTFTNFNLEKAKNIKVIDWSNKLDKVTAIYEKYAKIFNHNLAGEKIIFIDDGSLEGAFIDKEIYNTTLEQCINTILELLSIDQITIKPHPRTALSTFFSKPRFIILPQYIMSEFLCENKDMLIVTIISTSIIGLSFRGLKCISLVNLFEFKDSQLSRNFTNHFIKAGHNIEMPNTIKELHSLLEQKLAN